MTLRIEQDASYAGNHHWRWTLRLRGRQAELDRVAQVTWLLHESFTPPVVETADRTTRFALAGSGWGGFDLRAKVLMRNGRSMQLEHELVLFYPDEPVAEAAPGKLLASAVEAPPRKVFLSYGSEDRKRAAELRALVDSLGATATDARSQPVAGESWRATVLQMLHDSDVVLAVVSSDFLSPFLIEELTYAARLRKPLLLLKGEGVDRVPGLPDDKAMLSMPDGDDDALRKTLAGLLRPNG